AAGGPTQYTEDAASAADPVGTANILVRKDTPAAITSADGDNIAQRGTDYGAAYVQLVTSAGAYIDSVGGGTESTEDAAAAAHPVGKASILVRADTPAAIASADGDNVAQRGTDYGAAYVTLLDTGGSPVAVGGGTQYTEDAAAAANPIGNALILVRDDTPGALTSADGDNVAARGSDYGAMYVTLVDNAGSFLSVGGGTQYTEDAAAAANPVGNAINLIRDDALARTVSADGDNVAQGGSAAGAAYVEIVASTTKLGSATDGLLVNLGANNDVTVTGTVTANLAAGTNNIGDVDVLSIAAGDNNIGNVDIVTMPNVTLAAGTNTNEVVGDVAHDAAVGGNPLLIGFEAKDQDGAALPNAVNAEGDLVRGAASLSGVLYVMPVTEDGSAVATVNVNSHAVTNAGTFAVQESGAALTALQLIDNPVLVDDAAFTPGTSSVMMAGFQADESSTDSVNEGDAGAARMTLDRKVIVTPLPHTAGGLSAFMSIDLDETEEDVKTSAGQVYSISAFNHTAAPLYLRFYNATAANTTVGTTAAALGPFTIPGNADSDGAGFVWNSPHGVAFGTAICAAVTTGIAANDTGAPAANAASVVVGYM
ncbi:MAG: hypothetical protein IT577_24580, partial [Verrucomicrobiae bacterium]|nr:hypothetical protein [Verrucomicrobiae bacterium]